MSEAATDKDQQPLPSSYPGWLYGFEREMVAYEKVREQLLRDHLGKFVLIHQDEVVGVFKTPDAAIMEGGLRFGSDFIMVNEIRASEEPEFLGSVDITPFSFRPID